MYLVYLLCHTTVRLPSSYQIPSCTVMWRMGGHLICKFVYNCDYIRTTIGINLVGQFVIFCLNSLWVYSWTRLDYWESLVIPGSFCEQDNREFWVVSANAGFVQILFPFPHSCRASHSLLFQLSSYKQLCDPQCALVDTDLSMCIRSTILVFTHGLAASVTTFLWSKCLERGMQGCQGIVKWLVTLNHHSGRFWLLK